MTIHRRDLVSTRTRRCDPSIEARSTRNRANTLQLPATLSPLPPPSRLPRVYAESGTFSSDVRDTRCIRCTYRTEGKQGRAAICADFLRGPASKLGGGGGETLVIPSTGIGLLSRVHGRVNEGTPFRRRVISRNHALEVSTAVFVSSRAPECDRAGYRLV